MRLTSNLEIAWAAGFYEGEGSLSACGNGSRLILFIGQTDTEPLEKFRSAVSEGKISGPCRVVSKLSRLPFYRFQANGEAALRCVRPLWPMLSRRRQDQILRALMLWMSRPVGNRRGVKRITGAPKPTAWSERLHIRAYVPEETEA